VLVAAPQRRTNLARGAARKQMKQKQNTPQPVTRGNHPRFDSAADSAPDLHKVVLGVYP
jgi:hypothetical protein